MMRSLIVIMSFLSLFLYSGYTQAEEPSPDITGCWCGHWESCTDGHSGPLWASICKVNDDCYQARFGGRFLGIIPFRYVQDLRVVKREGNKITLAGERQLGPIMGTFSYTATVTAHDFVASYSSKRDSGSFIMRKH